VTPRLLEKPDGNPNFIMKEEYPAAVTSGIGLLPVEMEQTDPEALRTEFPGLPDCVSPEDLKALQDNLLRSVCKLATEETNSPEHNYLIGLAYLEGIDVEVNRERGLEMITSAAEAGLYEAMKKLFTMYRNGIGTAVSYEKATHWAERIADYFTEEYGDREPITLAALSNLAVSYDELGEHQKALELQVKVYTLFCKILGQEHPNTLTALSNIGELYRLLGDTDHSFYEKALPLGATVYRLRCKVLGETHEDTLVALCCLSMYHFLTGDIETSLSLCEKLCIQRAAVLGENHPTTVMDRKLAERLRGLLKKDS
ncbi:MAG: SEL1-like repeat protein, partial [Oscillospiraceae bacterium]|nr:SEL1-like repeat protein [Oscillospiraceae bacterium]